jgi:hypothetical protein
MMNSAKSRMRSSLSAWTLLSIVLLCGFAGGCAPARRATPSSNNPEEVYRPPTVIAETPLVVAILPSPTPTGIDLRKTARPTATPDCNDDLRFLEDLTIPDGAQIAPGEIVDKRWTVENAGSCNWDRRYRLRMVEGTILEQPVEQALYPARSGTRAIIQVLFTAEKDPGSYHKAWQAFNPEGEAFGDVIYVEYVISGFAP